MLRGLVIVIMALDHVRDFVMAGSLQDPLSDPNVSPSLFMTRWITHIWAPVFVFLAGTSAGLMTARKSPAELGAFLAKRGLWLILVEVTPYANQMKGADEDHVRVYVDGLYGYVKDGKAVFPEYNEGLHCAEVEPVKGVPIKRGWDFGLTPACVFTQMLPEGRWIVFEEICGEDLGISTFADCVLQLSAQRFSGYSFEDYGDPAGEQRSAMTADKAEKTCFDILKGKGIPIRTGEQNLVSRLESVRKPLNTLREGKPHCPAI